MTDAVPIRPGIAADSDVRRELEQTALEAIRVAAERGELWGIAIVAFSSDANGLYSVRRAHAEGKGSPPVSFLEAKAAAILIASSSTGIG